MDLIFESVGVHTADFADFLTKRSGSGHEFPASLEEKSPKGNSLLMG